MFERTSDPGRCGGTLPRRSLLRAGCLGGAGLCLADLERLLASGAQPDVNTSGKSLIVLWLWGGASHMETFDLKPQAPREYRGEFAPIRTNVPGIEISEHLPGLAQRADRFSLLRSVSHESNGHVNSTHTMLSAYRGAQFELQQFKK